MSNYISLLLEAAAANRRLAHLFQSERVDGPTSQPITMATHDSGGVARREKDNKMPQENYHERTMVSTRTKTTSRDLGSGATQRDLSFFSFTLALVLAGVVVAAHTDDPVFWLLVGPIPVAILY